MKFQCMTDRISREEVLSRAHTRSRSVSLISRLIVAGNHLCRGKNNYLFFFPIFSLSKSPSDPMAFGAAAAFC